MIKASIVMATYNHSEYLERTFKSIFKQQPEFSFEVIVVNDGSTDNTEQICRKFPVRYAYLNRPYCCNASAARNVGYRMAQGEIIIDQSDEVEHKSPDAISKLVFLLRPSTCVFATVENISTDGKVIGRYTGRRRHRPYFFLGSLWKKDLFAIGGQDEEFVYPGCEDRWMAECLRHLGIEFLFTTEVLGWHWDHPRSANNLAQLSMPLFLSKTKLAESGQHPWTSKAGSWRME